MGDIDGAFRAWGFQKGGTGEVSMAIARSAEYFGVDIKTEASVMNVIVKNNKAIGVALENGEEFLRPIEISDNELNEELKNKGIFIKKYSGLNENQKNWCDSYFLSSIFPLLTPLVVDLSLIHI